MIPERKAALLAVVGLALATGEAGAQTFETLIGQANAAEQGGRYGDASRLWSEAYAISGGDPTFLFLAASSAGEAGDADTTLQLLRRALEVGFFVPPDKLEAQDAFAGLRSDARWDPLLADARERYAGYDLDLRTELLDLARRDQESRAGIDTVMARYGRESPQGDSVMTALAAADAPIQKRLFEILEAHGWPGRRMVADDGAHAAWLIVQHAPAAEQRKALPMLKDAARAGDARPSDVAYLEDRLRVTDGKPQRYGTQLSSPDAGGAPRLAPIADEACVDRRRAEALLEPLADYLRRFGVEYDGPPGECEPKGGRR